MQRTIFTLLLLVVTSLTGCYVAPASGYYYRARPVVVVHGHHFRR